LQAAHIPPYCFFAVHTLIRINLEPFSVASLKGFDCGQLAIHGSMLGHGEKVAIS
jgi:hypothetical protein